MIHSISILLKGKLILQLKLVSSDCSFSTDASVLLKSIGFTQHLHHQLSPPLTEPIRGLPNLYRQNAGSTSNWEKVPRCLIGHSL